MADPRFSASPDVIGGCGRAALVRKAADWVDLAHQTCVVFFLTNFLIQISSSSKAAPFLWTAAN